MDAENSAMIQGAFFAEVVEGNGRFEMTAQTLAAQERGAATVRIGFPPSTKKRVVQFLVESNATSHSNEVHVVEGINWRRNQKGAICSDGFCYTGYCEGKQASIPFSKCGDVVQVVQENGACVMLVNGSVALLLACKDSCTISVRVHSNGKIRIIA